MRFCSHSEPKEILLKDHLQSVGNKSREIIISKKFNEEINKEYIADVSYLIGISHDFGKYTTFFQEKLKQQMEKGDPLTFHGLISALFTFEVLKEYIKTKKLDDKKPYKFLPLFGYFVVKHHHGDLKAIEDDVKESQLFEQFKKIPEQLQDIDRNIDQIKKEYNELFQDYDIPVEDIYNRFLDKYKENINSSSDIEDAIEEINKQEYFCFHKDITNITYYLLALLLYSVLIDSDKKHAGGVREIYRKELPLDLVEKYLRKPEFKANNTSKINDIRDEIRKLVIKKTTSIPIDDKIFTITAPTGTGKTLTSLSAALILRKRITEELKLEHEPRIIYSLPFTSIIDQNYNVFDDVLQSGQISDFKENDGLYILKHHHLSEIFYKTKDIDKEDDIEESLALIESWESEIIITTFIQLFYTLIGYKNRSLKKFHNIVNSIILLDEVQNIPIKYWPVVREILIAMSNYFNCRVILITATKPLIFEEDECTELLDNHEKYFKSDELNRVVLNIDSRKKRIQEFCNDLNDWSKNSYLFVFNTIQSSLDFYGHIKKKIQTLELIFKVCYLSTNIIPKERRGRIELIKKALDDGEKIIIVSTQLIEAGVDIDCDCVYRDIGPLDSIIQVAGRCNRNKRFEVSDMYILNLIKEDGGSFTKIYDDLLIKITNDILNKYVSNKVNEKEFLKLINMYFQETKKQSNLEKRIIDSLYKLYFYDKDFSSKSKRTPISEFELIKEEHKQDIFVELDEEAIKLRESYENLKEIKDGKKRRTEWLKLKQKFYNYVISIWSRDEIKNLPFLIKDQMLYLSNKDLKDWYKPDIGFDPSPDASFNSRYF